MIPENCIPTHPGEVLLEEFLNPLGITQVRFAEHIDVPVQRVNEVVRGKRGITPAKGPRRRGKQPGSLLARWILRLNSG